MTKAAIIEALAAMGVTATSDLTLPELRELLREKKESNPTLKDHGNNLLYKTSAMNKAQLQEHVRAQGIPITGNEVKDKLICLLKAKQMEQKPLGSDLMDFGEHRRMTYEGVAMLKPEYCKWCQTTAEEGESGPKLIRFVNYLNTRTGPKVEVKKQEMKTDRGTSSTARTKEEFPGTSTDARIDRLESMVHALLTKVASTVPVPDMDESSTGKRGKPM